MTVPRGYFEPGGTTGLAKAEVANPMVPIPWLEQHPATRRWWGKSARANLPAAETRDTALVLQGGFEGLIQWWVILGMAATQGANSGQGQRLYINDVPYWQTRWQAGAATLENGFLDYLDGGDGMGNSWGEVNVWLEEKAVVEIGIINNGGPADPLGWILRGIYWPVGTRQEWRARGWRQ